MILPRCFGSDLPFFMCEKCESSEKCTLKFTERLFADIGICAVCENHSCFRGRYHCDEAGEDSTLNKPITNCDAWVVSEWISEQSEEFQRNLFDNLFETLEE